MNWWLAYLSIAVGATVVTAIATPLFRALARRVDFVDRPLGEFHKKHGEATPLLGGAAILTGWAVTVYGGLGVALLLTEQLPATLQSALSGLASVRGLLVVIGLGGIVLTVVGIVDDKKPMGPLPKFLLQLFVCGFVATYPKLQITLFWDHPVVTWLLTVGWYLFIVNAFNFFDNMDGLASGTACIAATLFVAVAGLREQWFVAALGAATAGAAFGFYLFNRHPASIFMGDAGSHFLGYLLATLGALTLFYHPESSPTVTPVLIPLFILALPIFDAFAVVVIRLRAGQPIYAGDHNHISHRFLRMGVSQKTAVTLVHLLCLAIGLGVLPLMWLDTRGAILVLLQAVAMLSLVSILHGGHGGKDKEDE